jgi:hypothetical protein
MTLYPFVGYLVSFFFIVLTFVFFIKGIYLGYKYYFNPPYTKDTGYKFFYFGSLSLGFSLFFFLTIEKGSLGDAIFVSVDLVITLVILIFINSIIRRKTAMYLKKRNAFKPPLELIKDIAKMYQSSSDANIDKEESQKNKYYG